MVIVAEEDIDREGIQQRHRDVMLDLILTWGSLDGALGIMLSRITGQPLVETAQQFLKSNGSTRFHEMRKAIKAVPGGEGAASKLKKYKKKYEEYADVRNAIAHSHCAGTWKKDHNFLAFAAFEPVDGDQLGLNLIPLEEMIRATDWGRAMIALAVKIANSWTRSY